MSKSAPSTTNRNFWIIAGTTVALSSVMLVSFVPFAQKYRVWEAERLVVTAQSAPAEESAADYRLAYRLDPTNSRAALHFAELQTNSGRPVEALAILSRADESREVIAAQTRAAIEAGQPSQAMAFADKLLAADPTAEDIVLSAMAYGFGGESARSAALEPLVTAPEAVQSVRRAAGDKLALATVLASRGLLVSASGLLVKTSPSTARASLLAKIYLQQGTVDSLNRAVDVLKVGLIINPADMDLRKMLVQTYTQLNLTAEAAEQQRLLDKLIAGRP